MDILYIIGENCSKCNYNELRYSLRSIEQYGKNVDKVYVAGYCPSWLSDEVVKLPFTQPYKIEGKETEEQCKHKAANIVATILYAIDNSDISDEFLVSMDDHFYVRSVDFDNYPFYVKKYGENNKLPVNGKSPYKAFLSKSRLTLETNGLTKYYLCPHRNMHCSKKTISECREKLNSIVNLSIECEGIVYILNYRLTHDKDFEMTEVEDVKIRAGSEWYKTSPNNTEVFSTCDFESGSPLDCLINNLYKIKSKYEND